MGKFRSLGHEELQNVLDPDTYYKFMGMAEFPNWK